MTPRRRTLATAAAVLLAVGLAGCGSVQVTTNLNDPLYGVKTGEVDLPDGRTVLCVFREGGGVSGVSCDWDGAR